MEQLRDLEQLYNTASDEFKLYEGKDFLLPNYFKEKVKEINGSTVTYNDYSVIIRTKNLQRSNLNIFLPNQWFYIASYFTDYYNELMLYRKYALKITTKERLKVLNNGDFTEEEQKSLQNLPLSEYSKDNLKKFITDYSWWHGAKTIDRGDFYVSPILACANLVNASQSYITDLCAFLAEEKELTNSIITKVNGISNEIPSSHSVNDNYPLQQIFYGAPGTGKSHAINNATSGEDVIRTTFHPDTDYSTFVGAYKPTTIEETVMTVIGTKAVPVENADGTPRTESKIVYEFVPQAFLQAYINAWKKFATSDGMAKKQFLVIEEINRGNCAQIFGDLFQLLDRNDNGFSDYPIKADSDMQRQLQKAFAGLDLYQKDALNAMYNGSNVAEEVMNGDIILLPNNLYIWATMNTSDQSLFPIDSAFKRRWDWTYMPISNADMDWKIGLENEHYDWWCFLEKINEKIGGTTNSEDKKLGYFFCKARNGVITTEKFVGKVIFYLWNDVFKDYEFGDAIFNDEDGSKLTFDKFYTAEGRDSKVVTEKVALFLKNLGLNPISTDSADETEELSEIDNISR